LIESSHLVTSPFFLGTASGENLKNKKRTIYLCLSFQNRNGEVPGMQDDKIVRIEHLSKKFGKLEVLKDVSFDVSVGERVVIMGPSGTGKSTLLKCINFVEEYDGGQIIIEDKLMGYIIDEQGRKKRAPKERIIEMRKKIGMVFQSFNLFPHLTVIENITKAPILTKRQKKKEAIEKAMELLKEVNLSDKMNAYPVKLSGGQQQRVAIARALAMEPKIMLFDEVTSALDPALIREVLEVLIKLAKKGLTMIIITHELKFAENIADRILFLDQGYLVEEGLPKEILYNPKTSSTRKFLTGFY